MGSIIVAPFPDSFARQYNGVDQYDYILNPSYNNDLVGAVSIWVRVNRLLTADGAETIFSVARAGVTTSRYIVLELRRNSTLPGPTNTYIGVQQFPVGGTGQTGYSMVPITLGSWMHIVMDSTGAFYLNGALQSMTTISSALQAQWFGTVSSTSHVASFGARVLNTSFTKPAQVDVNEYIYLNAVPTSGEVLELYGGGTPPDPASFSIALRNKISVYLNFEQTLVPVIGSGTLTPVSSPAYIAFP